MRTVVLLATLAAGVLGMPDAFAQGGAGGYRGPAHGYRGAPTVRVRPAPVVIHRSVGYGWGVPFGAWWYGWPGPAPYYAPAIVSVPSAPATYVEQEIDAPVTPAPGYWYWCAEPQGYFPDVRECAGGWQAVMPRPEQPPRVD